MNYRAILFDMDGVLFDSEPIGQDLFFKACALQHLTITEQQCRATLGVPMNAAGKMLESWFPGRADGVRLRRDWIDLMLDQALKGSLHPKPFADELLTELKRQGRRIALCTSNESILVNAYLSAAGWSCLFDAVITADMIQKGKPAPDIYLRGAQALDVPVSRCIGVEDSRNGLLALRAAGMLSVMVPDLLAFTDDLAPYVDLCFNDLGRFGEWLSKEDL